MGWNGCVPCFLGTRCVLLILKQFPNFLFQEGTYGRPACISSVARLGLRIPVISAAMQRRLNLAGWDLKVAETLVHAWWTAEEDGDVLVGGVDPCKGAFAQFH